MRISDWSSDVCSSDLTGKSQDWLFRNSVSFCGMYTSVLGHRFTAGVSPLPDRQESAYCMLTADAYAVRLRARAPSRLNIDDAVPVKPRIGIQRAFYLFHERAFLLIDRKSVV